MGPPTLTPFLVAAILAWRVLVTARDAREASRRWSLRPALPWAGLLVGVDAVAIAAAVWLAAPFDSTDGTVVALVGAVVAAAAVRALPLPRRGRRTSLRRLALARIEQAAYDRADDWIYREVYLRVPVARMKPFVNAIRETVERQPGPQGSLDASYVAGLIHAGRTPSREDLRAACHRMLARHGRRRLVELAARYRGETLVEPADLARPGLTVPGPATLAVYIETDDQDSARRVMQAAEAVARVVGDAKGE